MSIHGLNLDWHRFNTAQVTDFCRHEIAPLKAANASLPVTTNFMEYFYDYDYWQLAEALDFISWDSYPMWHRDKDETALACYTAMYHDMMRSLKGGKPFVLMESTPGATNWQPTSKLKKPGMHILSSLQAVAHGADSGAVFPVAEKPRFRLRNFTAQWSTTSDILIPALAAKSASSARSSASCRR